MHEIDRSIEGKAKTISEILEKKKYSIDYYQREYKWETKQIVELVDDLTNKFLEIYEPTHEREDVAHYPGYFLGSFIISQKGSESFIVDGQQRLTSITLFLAYLQRLQQNSDSVVDIESLVYSEKFGKKSFNIDVEDRARCMAGLLEDGHYEPDESASDSVYNLVSRFADIEESFPADLKEKALPYFIDWFKDKVQLVQITAFSDDDAYAIFETMNDRGLKLTPADMLKGYILANIREGEHRNSANELWRKRMREIHELVGDDGAEFLKTWLRSQYSTKIREGRRGAVPENWDKIGTEFHRWVRTEHETLGLTSKENFYRFVTEDFQFYSRQYLRIVQNATGVFDPQSSLRFIRYNHDIGFTLQTQLLLAPLAPSDPVEVIDQKLELVARFINIYSAWRIWNSRTMSYSSLKYAMLNFTKRIRLLSVQDLAQELYAALGEIEENFTTNPGFAVHQQNRGQIHKLLARMTEYVEVQSGWESRYVELSNGTQTKYEVEHIWANHYDRHTDEFDQESDFARHRNLIGDLLLLPKQFNASYNDEEYMQKVPHYLKQNLLAASLHTQAYEKNPGFLRFIKSSGLNFKPYDDFKAEDITERGKLYVELAQQVWNPEDLLAVAA